MVDLHNVALRVFGGGRFLSEKAEVGSEMWTLVWTLFFSRGLESRVRAECWVWWRTARRDCCRNTSTLLLPAFDAGVSARLALVGELGGPTLAARGAKFSKV